MRRPDRTTTPRWTVGLLGLLLVGIVLIGLGLAWPRLRVASRTAGAPPGQAELRLRLADVMPPGQTTGFAMAPDGSLGIVDRARRQVLRVDAEGRSLATWGPRFEANAEVQDLGGLAYEPRSDTWYLLDRGRPGILALDPRSGTARDAIDLQPLGTYGPNGLAVDDAGTVYVADTGRSRVLAFARNATTPRVIGTAGTGPGQLRQPVAVAVDPAGALLVADLETHRIQRFDATGAPAGGWHVDGPVLGVAVDRLGRVFVPAPETRAVRLFSATGDLQAELGTTPETSLQVDAPTGLAVTPDGTTLWVLGRDGLTRVDLTTLAPPTSSTSLPGTSTLLVFAGGLLVLSGVLGFVWLRPWTSATGGKHRWSRPNTAFAGGLLLLGLGVLLVALCQALLQTSSGRAAPWPILGLQVVGALLAAGGAAATQRAAPLRWIASWTLGRAAGARVRLAGRRWIGLAASGVLALGATAIWWTDRFTSLVATGGLWIWLLSIALACAALTTYRRPRPTWWTLLPWLLFAGALVPRLWDVADLPWGIWYDDAVAAVEIRRVVQSGVFTPVINTFGRDVAGFYYVMALLWPVFGDTAFAMRAGSAILSALTVPVVYLLGRELYGWRVGLVAAVLLAVLRWHLNRLGYNPVSLPLCAALAVWLLARGVRRRTWRDLFWAGLALGVGMHAYTAFRVMPAVLLGGLVLAFVLGRWRPGEIVRGATAYGAAALLVALPVLVFAIQDPGAYNARTAQTFILASSASDAEKLGQIWGNVQRHLLMFSVQGDLNGRHNLPGAPMLDTLTAGLVALGLGWVLLRLLTWRSLVLLAWAGAALTTAIVTLAYEAPHSIRSIGVVPVVALFGALGLVSLLDRLVACAGLWSAVQPRRLLVAVAAASTLLLGWIGLTNIDFYFNRQSPDPSVYEAFSTRETIPARAALAGRGGFERILTSVTMAPVAQTDFLVPDLQQALRPLDLSGDLPVTGSGPVWIFLETEHDQPLVDTLARLYPDAVRTPIRAPAGGPAFVERFDLSTDVIDEHRGIAQTGAGWRAGLRVDPSGVYGLRAPAGARVRIDDATLPSEGGRVWLARGLHVLEADDGGAVSAGLEWRPPGAGDWTPVPRAALFVLPPGGVGLQADVTTPDSPSPLSTGIEPFVARYYHASPLARQRLDPPRWTSTWTGFLEAPTSGSYNLDLKTSQPTEVWLDEQLVLQTGTDRPRDAVTRELSAGRHALRVQLAKTSDATAEIQLTWTPPGGTPEVIPPTALYPPRPTSIAPV
jgi:hypothetical protein